MVVSVGVDLHEAIGVFTSKCKLLITSRYAILSPWLTQKIFAGLLCDQPELFELVVGALDFAFVDREFLGEGGGGREGFT